MGITGVCKHSWHNKVAVNRVEEAAVMPGQVRWGLKDEGIDVAYICVL